MTRNINYTWQSGILNLHTTKDFEQIYPIVQYADDNAMIVLA
jgi:hypothetical protein